MEGVSKPPILLAAGGESFKSGQGISRNKINSEMSAFKTVSSMGNRTLGIMQTASKLGICSYNDTDCHLIELTEREERVLNGVFEHYSHIDEATKKRLIKAGFVLEIF